MNVYLYEVFFQARDRDLLAEAAEARLAALARGSRVKTHWKLMADVLRKVGQWIG